MNLKEMISVIIPTYNREKTIVRAVNSVLCQTYRELEVLVVDDGSKDKTLDLLNGIKDPRLRVIQLQKNSGACHARNVGIVNSCGNYISFQDSDDEWFPNKLEIEYEFLVSNELDIVACAFYKYQNNRKKKWPVTDIKENYFYRILCGNYISTQALLVKRECLLNELFDENLPRYQDWELSIRLLSKYKFGFINRPLFNLYIQSDSLTNNYKAGMFAAEYILKKHEDKYLQYPESSKMLKNILAYGKMRSKDFEINYYKKIIKEYGFDAKIFIRYMQFVILKICNKYFES